MASAEEAYAFTHTAIRDAAYQLWLPSDRANLHLRALEIIEAEGQLDKFALELANHAAHARQGGARDNAALMQALSEKEFDLLKRALSVAKARFERKLQCELLRRIIALCTDPGFALESALDLALVLYESGIMNDALEQYHQSVEVAEKLERYDLLSAALLGEGKIIAMRGKSAEAERLLERSIACAKEHGLASQQSLSMSWLAGLFEDTGRRYLAEGMFKDASAVARFAGNENLALGALGNLANFYRATGRLQESLDTLLAVRAGFVAAGNEQNEVVASSNLGRCYFMLGRHREAEECFNYALERQAKLGRNFSYAFALGSKADVAAVQGKFSEALEALVACCAQFQELAQPMYFAGFTARLAALRLLLGEREQAQELAEEARANFEQSGSGLYIADYCDIVRLRIAVDLATQPEMSRQTRKISLAPNATWLPVARQLLKGMQNAIATRKLPSTELKTHTRAAEMLVAELEAALRENRAARIFRGYLPAELSAEQRVALLRQLETGRQSELSLLRKFRPEVPELLAQ